MFERLPAWSLERICSVGERCGEIPSMSLFRKEKDLCVSTHRASTTDALTVFAQRSYTARLMHELEQRWARIGEVKAGCSRMRCAEQKLGDAEKSAWRQMAKDLDCKVQKLKLAPQEEEVVLQSFAHGLLDQSIHDGQAARGWSCIRKIFWRRESVKADELRLQNQQKLKEAVGQMKLAEADGGTECYWKI